MRFWFKFELGGPKELKDNLVLSLSVPRKIRVLYTEAKICFEAGAYRASVVMLRAAAERISDSGDRKNLTVKQLKIMRRIRTIGNDTAHGKPVSPEVMPTLLSDFGSVVCSIYRCDDENGGII